MLIRDMSHQDCLDLLGRARQGRLACSRDNQPYITPGYFAFEDGSLYGFSTVGQKINWMRANPRVCAEFEEIRNSSDWATVVVTGAFEELLPTPEHDAHRTRAYHLLQKYPSWWEPGYAKTQIKGENRALDPLYFRIVVDQVSGRRSMADAMPLVVADRRRSLLSRFTNVSFFRRSGFDGLKRIGLH